MRKNLKKFGWEATNFKYWKLRELVKNANRCKIIHMHFPEAYWRSTSTIICGLKIIHFLFVFHFSKVLGYKWVFSAHNVIPHLKVKSYLLERLMRLFILNYFDLIIGLAFNTKNDLNIAFGNSGKKYLLALHGTYEDCYPIKLSRDQFLNKYSVPNNAKILLTINSFNRPNQGLSQLIEAWLSQTYYGNVYWILTGHKPENLDKLNRTKKFIFIEGRVDNELIGSILNSVDFMLFNYASITTSGLFFLSVTFKLPIIAPNLPFFSLHSSNGTAILFDRTKSLSIQLKKIIRTINDGWDKNVQEFDCQINKYKTYNSAKLIANEFNLLNIK